MGVSVAELQTRFYPVARQRDAVALFLDELEPDVGPSDLVLDIGAGAGERNRYAFKGRVAGMWGVDLDPRVTENPLLDRGVVGDGKTLPFDDGSVDVAFSIYVHEHLDDPGAFAREIYRVLKPDGRYLALTPNRFHYVPLIATLTPTSFHRWLNAKRGRSGEDTFPTYYRLNTAAAVQAHFRAAGFSEVIVNGIEVEPQYLKFHPLSYVAGVAYERVVNSSRALEGMRVNLIVRCSKT